MTVIISSQGLLYSAILSLKDDMGILRAEIGVLRAEVQELRERIVRIEAHLGISSAAADKGN